jgi:hypothetical protein
MPLILYVFVCQHLIDKYFCTELKQQIIWITYGCQGLWSRFIFECIWNYEIIEELYTVCMQVYLYCTQLIVNMFVWCFSQVCSCVVNKICWSNNCVIKFAQHPYRSYNRHLQVPPLVSVSSICQLRREIYSQLSQVLVKLKYDPTHMCHMSSIFAQISFSWPNSEILYCMEMCNDNVKCFADKRYAIGSGHLGNYCGCVHNEWTR